MGFRLRWRRVAGKCSLGSISLDCNDAQAMRDDIVQLARDPNAFFCHCKLGQLVLMLLGMRRPPLPLLRPTPDQPSTAEDYGYEQVVDSVVNPFFDALNYDNRCSAQRSEPFWTSRCDGIYECQRNPKTPQRAWRVPERCLGELGSHRQCDCEERRCSPPQ